MCLSLHLQCGSEPEGGDADGDPRQLIRNADKRLQPAPQVSSADETSTEAQKTDGTGDEDSNPWHLIAIELSQEARCVAFDSERIHQSRASEERMVTSAQDARQDDRIDEASGCFGASHLEDDREG